MDTPNLLAPDSSPLTQASRISLNPSPTQWFDFLRELSSCVHLGCTSAAQMGVRGPLQVVRLDSNPVLPQSECGRFQPNLAEHSSIVSIEEASEAGKSHAFEVRDVRGRICHRILAPTEGDLPAWNRFARTQRSLNPDTPVSWYPANHSSSLRRVGALSARRNFLYQRLRERSPDARLLSHYHLTALLLGASRARIPFRTLLYNRALILSSVWTPSTLLAGDLIPEPSRQQVTRVFGDDTGLQLNHDPEALAFLWTGVCSCCGLEKWAIEVCTSEGELALAITAPTSSHEIQWRNLITDSIFG